MKNTCDGAPGHWLAHAASVPCASTPLSGKNEPSQSLTQTARDDSDRAGLAEETLDRGAGSAG
jgi:hypothetical protein